MLKDKLCLGTVQFGLEYGINNRRGKPSSEEVFNMLDHARARGIKYLDTAAAYGNAEELLGAWFQSRGCRDEFKVISKLRPNLIEDDGPTVPERVVEQVRGSLERLQIPRLNGYLLHTPANFYNAQIIKGLQQAKELGLTENIGVSIYEVETALDVVRSGLADYIQIPYNAFDQRLEGHEFQTLARANGVTVFARSPFLQGLLFMEADTVPVRVAEARAHLDEFAAIVSRHGFTRAEACMLFSVLNEGNDFVVFGVDSLDQLEEDISVTESAGGRVAGSGGGVSSEDSKDHDLNELRADLRGQFSSMEKAIIFPSLWARKD